MINFHTITLKAKELSDPITGQSDSEIFCSPVQMLFSKARNIQFCEGDTAEVLLTDGTRFIFFLENHRWTCCRPGYNRKGEYSDASSDLITLYGPYNQLEEALNDLISKRNYISAVN